jgi:hypothetical protein
MKETDQFAREVRTSNVVVQIRPELLGPTSIIRVAGRVRNLKGDSVHNHFINAFRPECVGVVAAEIPD